MLFVCYAILYGVLVSITYLFYILRYLYTSDNTIGLQGGFISVHKQQWPARNAIFQICSTRLVGASDGENPH